MFQLWIDATLVVGLLMCLNYMWSDWMLSAWKSDKIEVFATMFGLMFFSFPIIMAGMIMNPKDTLKSLHNVTFKEWFCSKVE